jgi:beta-lactamase class A
VAVRSDDPVDTLSVIKLPILVLAYRDVEAGALDLDERCLIAPEDLRNGALLHGPK